MMVSFLKSSHGLASQRRPGRDENLILSGSKIRKHDTVWKHIYRYVFLCMMLAVGSASKWFQGNELTPEFYKRFIFNEEFTIDNYRAIGRPCQTTERIIRDIGGTWYSAVAENPAQTDIVFHSFEVKSTLRNRYGKVLFHDLPTTLRLVNVQDGNQVTERLVLMVPQKGALWIITPVQMPNGSIYMKWHTNQNFEKHAKRRNRNRDFNYIRLMPESTRDLTQPRCHGASAFGQPPQRSYAARKRDAIAPPPQQRSQKQLNPNVKAFVPGQHWLAPTPTDVVRKPLHDLLPSQNVAPQYVDPKDTHGSGFKFISSMKQVPVPQPMAMPKTVESDNENDDTESDGNNEQDQHLPQGGDNNGHETSDSDAAGTDEPAATCWIHMGCKHERKGRHKGRTRKTKYYKIKGSNKIIRHDGSGRLPPGLVTKRERVGFTFGPNSGICWNCDKTRDQIKNENQYYETIEPYREDRTEYTLRQ